MARRARRPNVTVTPPASQRADAGFLREKGIFIDQAGLNPFLRHIAPGAQMDPRIQDAYREDPRVYAAVSRIGDSAASIPWKLFATDPKEDEEAEALSTGDPLVDLFDHVNPLMDAADLRERMTLSMETSGGVYWLLMNADGTQVRASDPTDMNSPIAVPEEIWPVSQHGVRPVVDKSTNLPIGFDVQMGGGRPRRFDAASVLHFKYPNPRGGFEGLAPLEVALARAEQVKAARLYQDSILENGGDPGGVLIVKPSTNPDAFENVQETVHEEWNNGQRVGDTRVLPADVEYQPNPIGPKDLQYGALTELNWKSIAEIFGVPESILGQRSANFAEHKLHLREFWTLKMLSLFRRYEQTLNSRFFPRLREARFTGYHIAFDTSMVEALQGDLLEQTQAAKELFSIGVPLNVALRKAGIELEEPIDGGDVGLVPAGLQPIEGIDEEQEETDAPIPPTPPDSDTDGEDDEVEDEESRSVSSASAGDGDPGHGSGDSARDGVGAVATTRGRSEEQRRTFEKATEQRRASSDRRIQARVRSWNRRLRAAQLAHLDKIASGKLKMPARTAPQSAPKRLMSTHAAESLVTAISSKNGALKRWERKHASLVARHGRDALIDGALMQKVQLTDEELEFLVLPIHEVGKWTAELEDELAEAFRLAFSEAADSVAIEIGGDALSAADVSDFLDAKLVKVSEGVNSTVASDLRRKLQKLFAESPTGGTGTIAEKLREVLPGAKSASRDVFAKTHRRAKTIARTETAQIDSHTRFETFKANDIEKHEWITTGDDRVREVHTDPSGNTLDGQVRRIDEVYETPVGTLRFCNDPEGPAGQIINCRCVMAPVIE